MSTGRCRGLRSAPSLHTPKERHVSRGQRRRRRGSLLRSISTLEGGPKEKRKTDYTPSPPLSPDKRPGTHSSRDCGRQTEPSPPHRRPALVVRLGVATPTTGPPRPGVAGVADGAAVLLLSASDGLIDRTTCVRVVDVPGDKERDPNPRTASPPCERPFAKSLDEVGYTSSRTS